MADQRLSSGGVGAGDYQVKQGDCLSSIAAAHGHTWTSIWNDAANADLRRLRKSPHVLFPGDRLVIPPLRKKSMTCGTELSHRFRRRGFPEQFRLLVYDDDDRPALGVPWSVLVDGRIRHSGQTDSNGCVTFQIPPNARSGRLRLASLGRQVTLLFGHLDPVDTISGVQGRLQNLGFDCGEIDNILGPQTTKAIRRFQERFRLPVTGHLDEQTRDKLASIYGV